MSVFFVTYFLTHVTKGGIFFAKTGFIFSNNSQQINAFLALCNTAICSASSVVILLFSGKAGKMSCKVDGKVQFKLNTIFTDEKPWLLLSVLLVSTS